MAITSIKEDNIGQTGVVPRIVRIVTDNTKAEVGATGFLNKAVQQGFAFNETDLCAVVTKPSPSATTSEVGWFEISKVGDDWSLTTTGEPGDVVLPTMPNYLAHFSDTQGTLSSAPQAVINDGNVQAGIDGSAGAFVSYPPTAGQGTLTVEATNAGGAFDTKLTNDPVGQSTDYQLPDTGSATSKFIMTDTAAAGQVINNGNLTLATGSLTCGSDGNQGAVVCFPPTADSGAFTFDAVDNVTGDFAYILRNSTSHSFDTIVNFPDPGVPVATVLLTDFPTPDLNANLRTVDTAVSSALLGGAGTVTIFESTGTKRYRIRNMFLNFGGTNFSGGGGDRDIALTDGTTVYSVIPAATVQALVNGAWGSAALPFPAAAALNTDTVAGASLVAQYSGGTADYAAGSLVISALFERVA